MAVRKKQVVSVRLEPSDIRRTKTIAKRLQTSESEVVRFALRQLFKRLGPLHNGAAHGLHLLPLFLEYGTELIEHFNVDATQVEQILNRGVRSSAEAVNSDDVALLATLADLGVLAPPPPSQDDSAVKDALERLHEQARAMSLIGDAPDAGSDLEYLGTTDEEGLVRA